MNPSDRIIKTVRILAIPTVIVGFLALVDGILPASLIDEAVVQSKEVQRSKGTVYNIKAQGRYHYSESVSREFFSAARVGMKLRLSLTGIFKEWKQVEILENDRVVFTGRGRDVYWGPAVGLLLILPCLCYRNADKWFNMGSLIVLAVIEFAGVLLFSKLVLVWLGFVDKM